jgi:hypothetical protein
LEITDNDLENFHHRRSPVFNKLRILEDEGIEYVIYFKRSEDAPSSSVHLWKEDKNGRRSNQPEPSPDGWLLHVAYLNDVSVLEYYWRSRSLTNIESEGILSRNAGDSRWVKGRLPNDDAVIQPVVFPADHYREDLAIYAKLGGDTIILFDPRLDARINLMNTEKAQEEAPESLEGF